MENQHFLHFMSRKIIVSRDEFRKYIFGYDDKTYNDYYKLHKEQIKNNEAIVSEFCNKTRY